MTSALPARSAPFDTLAPDYDRDFVTRTLGRWLRRRVWDRLEDHLPNHGRVLDLGCGTGEDALWLAARGAEVTGLDAAPAMLERARAKLERHGLGHRAVFECCDLADATGLAGLEASGATFDGAVSNFGALNCLPDLRPLADVLGRLMRPRARLVVVVMGPFCLWEVLAALAHGSPRGAFRRFRSGAPVDLGAGPTQRVWYPSSARVRTELAAPFRHLRTEALGLLLPPTRYADLVERHLTFFAQLERHERWLAGFPPSAWMSDHYLSVFERR